MPKVETPLDAVKEDLSTRLYYLRDVRKKVLTTLKGYHRVA